MKTLAPGLLALVGLFVGSWSATASAGQVVIIDDVDYFKDQFVVLADPAIGAASMRSSLAAAAGVPAAQVDVVSAKLGIYNVKLSTFTLGGRPVVQSTIFINQITINNQIQPMADVAGVTVVEPNYADQLYAYPNDTNYASQAPHLDPLSIQRGWDYARTAPGLVVAVLDEGILNTHGDLIANLWRNPGETNPNDGIDNDGNGYADDYLGWDFLYDESDTNPDEFAATETDTHGTYVAGIIAATGNNNLGIAGVVWQTQIMTVKVAGAVNNYNKRASHSALAEGLVYAVDNGADVLNYSGGGPADSRVRRLAFDYAAAADVPIVCAAGNLGDDLGVAPVYPAAYADANIIAVVASDPSGSLAGYSNFSTIHADLAAPGAQLVSTIFDDPISGDDLIEQPGTIGTYVKPFGEDSGLVYGTSSAAGVVTGALTLLKARHPSWTTAQLKAKLLASVDRIGNLPDVTVSGGRLNFAKLLDVPAQAWIDNARLTETYAYYAYLYGLYGYYTSPNSYYAYYAYAYNAYGYLYANGATQYLTTVGRDGAYADGYRLYQWAYNYYGFVYAYYGYAETYNSYLYYTFLYGYYAYTYGVNDYNSFKNGS